MGRLKPLQEISYVNSGDLIRLQLESSKIAKPKPAKNTVAAGYYWHGDKKLHQTPGHGYAYDEPYEAANNIAVDISYGTYLGSKILGFEIVTKYKP